MLIAGDRGGPSQARRGTDVARRQEVDRARIAAPSKLGEELEIATARVASRSLECDRGLFLGPHR
jgi:hypothetical protein